MGNLDKGKNDEIRRRRLAFQSGRRAMRRAKKQGRGGEAEVMAKFQSQGIDVSSNVFNYDKNKDNISRDRNIANKEIAQQKRNKLKGEEALSGESNVNPDGTTNTGSTGGNTTTGGKKKGSTTSTPGTVRDPFGGGTVESFNKGDDSTTSTTPNTSTKPKAKPKAKPKSTESQADRDNRIRKSMGLGTVEKAEAGFAKDIEANKPKLTLADYEKRDAIAAADPLIKSRSQRLDDKVAESRAFREKGDGAMLNDVDAPIFQALDRGEASVAEPFFKPEKREERSLGDFMDSRGVESRREEKRLNSRSRAERLADAFDETLHPSKTPTRKIDFGGSSQVSNPFAKPQPKGLKQLPETNDNRTGFAPRIEPLKPFKPIFTR